MRSGNEFVEPVALDENRQVAALIWRKTSREAEVLLVTSRVSGHWLLPKGWPIEGKSLAVATKEEAFEEAGVWGYCGGSPVGTYGYRKLLTAGVALDCVVDVFAIEAIGVLADWPEHAQRSREWFTLSEAADRVMEPDLARFLSQCDGQFVDQHFRSPRRPDALLSRPSDIVVNHDKETAMISAAQCRAARALIDWSIDHLASASGLSVEQLAAFETDGTLDRAANAQAARALEEGGASFIAERRGRGVGVRLKFGRQLVKRLDIWENEGGPTAGDDIA